MRLVSIILLIAGGCANDTPAWGGALTFGVSDTPSGAGWDAGSAYCAPNKGT